MDVLEQIMGVNEAAELWDLEPGTVKNYCAWRKVKARKIENRWIIDKNQPNPGKPDSPHNRGKQTKQERRARNG